LGSNATVSMISCLPRLRTGGFAGLRRAGLAERFTADWAGLATSLFLETALFFAADFLAAFFFGAFATFPVFLPAGFLVFFLVAISKV
jgi:hypothetical protein